MATVLDLRTVYVEISVYEKDLARVREGQPVQVRVKSFPDEEFRGRVTYLSGELDENTRTSQVRARLEAATAHGRQLHHRACGITLPCQHDAQSVLDHRRAAAHRREEVLEVVEAVVVAPFGTVVTKARVVETPRGVYLIGIVPTKASTGWQKGHYVVAVTLTSPNGSGVTVADLSLAL